MNWKTQIGASKGSHPDMPQVKQKRFDEMKDLPNVFEWSDYNSSKPFPSGTWSSKIFKNENPIVLELACGKGEYSRALGELYPDKNFVGVDIKGNRMWVGAKDALDRDLENVRYLRAYIDHLDQFFVQDEIDEIWILFPDPYINKERKRLTSPKFLELYRKVARKGTVINLKTDSDPLYEYTKSVIANQGLKLLKDIPDVHQTHKDHPELSIITYYEKMHMANGKTSKFLSFRL